MEIKIEDNSQQMFKELTLTSGTSADASMGKDDLKQELSASESPQKAAKKVYPCTFSFCSKFFTHRSTLVKHQRIHKGERPYQCKVCGQAFVQSSNLKRHMLVHTGEKPYNCDLCDKTFTTASNLKIHREVHKADQAREKFSCSHCKKGFLYKSSLSKHESKCAPKEDKETHEDDEEEITHEVTKLVKKEEEQDSTFELNNEHSVSNLESPTKLRNETECVNTQQQQHMAHAFLHEPEKIVFARDGFARLQSMLSEVKLANPLMTATQIRLVLPSINPQLIDQNLLMRSLALNVELLAALKSSNINSSALITTNSIHSSSI